MLPLAAAEGAFCRENGCGNYLGSPSRFLLLLSFSQLFPNTIPGDLRCWSITGTTQKPKSLSSQLLSPPSPGSLRAPSQPSQLNAAERGCSEAPQLQKSQQVASEENFQRLSPLSELSELQVDAGMRGWAQG